MQEMADPARALERARKTWQKQGRSKKWIEQRMTGQETPNKLTDYWAGHDIQKGREYAILTNILHQEWAGVSVKEYKTSARGRWWLTLTWRSFTKYGSPSGTGRSICLI